MDFDNKIGYWIENIPYLWVGDKDWRRCFRFYALTPDTIVHSITLRPFTISDVLKNVKSGNFTLNDFFSLIPMGTPCIFVRHYFLAYTLSKITEIGQMYKRNILDKMFPNTSKFEIRMNGKFFAQTSSYKIKHIYRFKVRGNKKDWILKVKK